MTSKTAEKTQKAPRVRDEHGRYMKANDSIVLPQGEFEQINQALAVLSTENYKLSEALQNVEMMVDAKGWSPLYGYDHSGGLSLDQLHASSKQLREMVVGNPFVKRGNQLRNTYVLGDGVEFSAISTTGKAAKLTATVIAKMESPRAVRYLFGSDAMEELQTATFTDGNVYVIGDDLKGEIEQRVDISQITADWRNPDNPEEIWAYRRAWTRDPNANNPVTLVRWYFTDIFDGTRTTSIPHGGNNEPVMVGKTILDMRVNRQLGWAYGAPDALASLAWAKLYKEFLVNGYIMSRALAQFAYKVTAQSAQAGAVASLQVARKNEGGSAYVAAGGGDMTPMATAGKGYDFDSGRPLAAAIAAGFEVSTVALTGDSGSGGGTGSKEQALDTPARTMAVTRRRTWNEFWVRVFRYMGNTKKLTVTWSDLPDEQIQRRLQAWTLLDGTGLFSSEVVRDGMAGEMDIANPGEIPEGRMLPNNAKTLELQKPPAPEDNPDNPDGDDDGDGDSKPGAMPSKGTGQGKSTGKGSGLGNDHSTD